MGVEVAADVVELDQLRQLAFARRLQLAAALAQLGLDVVVAEALVDRLLALAELDLAALGLGDPVLGDREAAGDRFFAQLHVVGLGAGEVLQQVAEGGRGDDPQVDRDAVVGLGADAVGAGSAGGGDQRVAGEVLGEGCRLVGGGDQVDVLAGLGPAPGRAGDLDPVGGRVLAQRRRQLLGDRAHLGEQQPAGARVLVVAEPLQLGQHPFLDLRPEPLELADLLRLGGGLEVLDRRHPELVEEAPGGFGPEAGDPGHLDQGRREFRLQLHRRRDLAGLQQGVDLFRQRLADPGDLGRPALRRQLGDRDRALADRGRGLAVGEDPVFDRAVELVENPQLIQRGGDLGVGHRDNLSARRRSGYGDRQRPPRGVDIRRYTF